MTSDAHGHRREGSTVAGSYRDLLVWQKGVGLVKEIHELTKGFPDEERFGLISQMRRAAASIPSNVAEGRARHATREFVHSISHAEVSLAELDTQLRASIEFGYCERTIPGRSEAILLRADELRRMLNALRRRLQ